MDPAFVAAKRSLTPNVSSKSIAGKRELTSEIDGSTRDVTCAPRVNNIYPGIETLVRKRVNVASRNPPEITWRGPSTSGLPIILRPSLFRLASRLIGPAFI